MSTTQLALFQRKTFADVVSTQLLPVSAPTKGAIILATLPAYYTYLQSGGYSKYTPDDFTNDVKKFGLFLRSKPIAEITVHDIRDFISTLRSKEKLSEKTISRKLSALQNYFTWLMGENVLASSPMETIHIRKITSPLPEILFEEECKKLLASASTDSRTYLLILLLLETGMKFEELADLNVNNFDLSNAYSPEVWIKHTGKKIKKDRKLKLPSEIKQVFSDYQREYAVSDKLFDYTPRFLRLLITTAAKNAGLTKHVSAQMLRDTCAVRMLRQGVDMEAVLYKLGFSETTWEDAKEKYLKLSSRGI